MVKKKLYTLILAINVSVLLVSQFITMYQPVSAASQNTFDSIVNNWPFYDPSDCVSNAASPTGASTGQGSSTIVLDPGHAPGTDVNVDPDTKEPVFDYENEPEMQQMWQVAQDVKNQLENDGYTVLLTKKSVNDSSTNLKQRAEVGNKAQAALGVSLHSTPGSPQHDNNVFYPGVGDYLVKTTGEHDVYKDQQLAAIDKNDANAMADALHQAENQPWKAGTYNDIYGPITRSQGGLTMKGTMLVTQYFAKIPWVYVEQTQNASGASVSSDVLKQYEQGIVKGVENIVTPPNGGATNTSASACCPPSAGGGTVSLRGKDAVDKTVNFFIDQGLSPAQAVGIAANFMWETGGGTTIDPLIAGPTPSGAAWGIAEWTPPTNYTQDKHAAGITGDDAELQTQLEVVWAEIQGKGTVYNTSILDGLKKIDNAGDAADYFRANFEKCDTSYASCSTDRITTANDLIKQYGGDSASPSGDATATISSDGTCSGGLTGGGGKGTADAAIAAAKLFSSYQVPYVWGGLHTPGALKVTDKSKLKSLGADCSGSSSWVLYQAGMFNETYGFTSGALESWGQAGEGQVMTVWANADHAFIEFKIPGEGHYEFNTAYWPSANGIATGGGAQFFKWGPAWDTTSGFTPRHWPGT